MNVQEVRRAFLRGPKGWSQLKPQVPAETRTFFHFNETFGAGPEARYLADCYRLFLVEPALPQSEGWQTPPAAVIPVQLSGLNDADWALEEDERGF